MKVLYLAYCTPYSKVTHAGGQTFNYYINNVAKKGDEVTLISFCEYNELRNIDIEKNNINFIPIIWPRGYKKYIGKLLSLNSKLNPYYKYSNLNTKYSILMLISKLKKLRNEGYFPDIIVLEWTQMVLMIDYIKAIYPKSKYVASEHDVTFLGWERKTKYTSDYLKKCYLKIQYTTLKKAEINALKKCDLIFTHNEKDRTIIINESDELKSKVSVLTPYYHKSIIEYKQNNNDILFFGYMARKENEISAIWFIENVMPKLIDLDIRFVIIGGGVTNRLREYESDKVIIKGYVEKIDKLFSEGFCFVAPLQLGAGIKVKVIEALQTGITVVANGIAIEGIDVENGKDFYYANKDTEYENIIRNLYFSKIKKLSGKNFIDNNFSLKDSFENYYNRICNIIG